MDIFKEKFNNLFYFIIDGSFLEIDNRDNANDCGNNLKKWKLFMQLFKRNRKNYQKKDLVSQVYLKLKAELTSILKSKSDEFYYNLFDISDKETRQLRRRLVYVKGGCSHLGLRENRKSHYCRKYYTNLY